MKYLNLSDNKLITLPDEIGDLTKLIELRVMNNQLIGLDISGIYWKLI
ncbi:hypothetical protein [Peribacillus loiseleuriae]